MLMFNVQVLLVLISLGIVIIALIIVKRVDRLTQEKETTKERRKGSTNGIQIPEYCYDQDFILFLQRKQWNRSKKEIHQTTKIGFQGKDMDFYLQPFGMMIVNLSSIQSRLMNIPLQQYYQLKQQPSSSSFAYPYDELAYYRIWKSGNSNIRSLLFQYAYQSDEYEKQQIKKKNLDLSSNSSSTTATTKTTTTTSTDVFNYWKFQQYCAFNDLQLCEHDDISDYAAEYMKSFSHFSSESTIQSEAKASHSLSHSEKIGKRRRYAFTFVRNPIDRFISGMTEIEYQLHQLAHSSSSSSSSPSSSGAEGSSQQRYTLPFKHQHGDLLRITEFIDFILLSSGSKNFFQNYRFLEILHIFPMIGTLLVSEKLETENDGLHVYKLETFEDQWKRLANAVFPFASSPRSDSSTNSTKTKRIPEYLSSPNTTFYELYSSRHSQMKNWQIHLSSEDPLQTTAAAKNFFSFINEDMYNRFQTKAKTSKKLGDYELLIPPKTYSFQKTQQLATKYFRFICRIYLIDFECFQYELPLICQDLQQEFDAIKLLYQKKKITTEKKDYLNSYVWIVLGPIIKGLCDWNLINGSICWIKQATNAQPKKGRT